MKRDLVIVVLSLALGFIAGFSCRQKSPQEPPIVKVDTLIVRDTFVRYKPIFEVRRVVDSILVPVTDTIRISDTVFVQLPREQLEWTDTMATVWVSGYLPAVDSVRHYTVTQVITVTEREAAPRWGIGIQGGIGAGKGGLTPYIGIGVHYNLVPLTR